MKTFIEKSIEVRRLNETELLQCQSILDLHKKLPELYLHEQLAIQRDYLIPKYIFPKQDYSNFIPKLQNEFKDSNYVLLLSTKNSKKIVGILDLVVSSNEFRYTQISLIPKGDYLVGMGIFETNTEWKNDFLNTKLYWITLMYSGYMTDYLLFLKKGVEMYYNFRTKEFTTKPEEGSSP